MSPDPATTPPAALPGEAHNLAVRPHNGEWGPHLELLGDHPPQSRDRDKMWLDRGAALAALLLDL